MAKCILLGSGGSSIDEDALTATPPKVIKSLTFLGAGSDEPQTGTLEINYANIAVGVTILGKTGTYTGKGNAGPGQVLKNYTASNSSESNFAGTLPNKGLLNDTNVGINYSKTLDTGYYSSIKVTQNLSIWESPSNSAGVITAYGGVNSGVYYRDNTRGVGLAVKVKNYSRLIGANWVFLAMPNLKPENIKNGVSIFGITGTAKSPFPDEDVFLFNEGRWMNEASNGASITCIEEYYSHPNGNTHWTADHSDYVNYGNPVGEHWVANTRVNDGNLYTEGMDSSGGGTKYSGAGSDDVHVYGYIENNRFRDVNGSIRNLNIDPPGYKIYLHVPAKPSKGLRLGQSRVKVFRPGDTNLVDPIAYETLQGYLINNSHKLYAKQTYYMYGWQFKYFTASSYGYPSGLYTGLRYCDVFQTSRLPGFYVYTYHNGRHYVDCWDTYVELRDRIDLSPYSDIVLSWYLVYSNKDDKTQSVTKYSYTVHCSIYLYYTDETTGREKSIRLNNGSSYGEALFDAAIGWTDHYSGEYNWGGSPVIGSTTIKINKIESRKYRIKFHFYNINDLGDTRVSCSFKEKCVITGIKLIPGKRVYLNPADLCGYDSCTKSGYGKNATYTYTNKINIVNDAIYVNENNNEATYKTLKYSKYFEGYNGRLDPFIIFKYNGAYYLNINVEDSVVTPGVQFIPAKVGKLYKVVELVQYLYNKTEYKEYYGTYNAVDFYVCTGYNSMEKIEKLYRYVPNEVIYSELKPKMTNSRYDGVDTTTSVVAVGKLNKIYRVYNIVTNDVTDGLAARYRYNPNMPSNREYFLYFSRGLAFNFYGYMKCTGSGRFEYVNSWEYPVPEDNPVATRVYNIDD